MNTDPTKLPKSSVQLAGLLVHDGDLITAQGPLVSAAGSYWTTFYPVVALPTEPIMSTYIPVSLADARSPSRIEVLSSWGALFGDWDHGEIRGATVTPVVYENETIKYGDPPIETSMEWVTRQPSWWSDREPSSASITAFRRAFDAGLVSGRSMERSERGYAMIITSHEPERAEEILRPVYGAALGIVRSRFSNVDHLFAAERIEAYLTQGKESRIMSYGQLLGSDYQNYEHLIIDRVSEEFLEFLDDLPAGIVAVQTWASPDS